MPRWHPDTCGCAFDVSDDWLTGKTIKACEHHRDAKDAFVAVRNENAFKNMAVAYAMEQDPSFDGGFSFTADGKLTLVAPETMDEKSIADVQAKIDEHFGQDAVAVQPFLAAVAAASGAIN